MHVVYSTIACCGLSIGVPVQVFGCPQFPSVPLPSVVSNARPSSSRSAFIGNLAEAVATFSVILVVGPASVEVGVASETDSAVSAGYAFG
mmetsp:Transcript_32424/g.58636  ORF Transcript_32424/g.58636 Transcript_32424/m.58636 type:complete len:90 (-) Transcript_32424:1326-1595(-)